MNTSLEITSIVKNLTIDAPVDRVFAALTDPRLLPKFWGEGVELWASDLRPGGRWASCGRLPDGGRFCVMPPIR